MKVRVDERVILIGKNAIPGSWFASHKSRFYALFGRFPKFMGLGKQDFDVIMRTVLRIDAKFGGPPLTPPVFQVGHEYWVEFLNVTVICVPSEYFFMT